MGTLLKFVCGGLRGWIGGCQPPREGSFWQEGATSAKAWAVPLGFVLSRRWTGPSQGPWALLEPGVPGLRGETVPGSRGEVMAKLRHPRLWPLPTAGQESTKHQDNGLPSLPPACPGATGPEPCPSGLSPNRHPGMGRDLPTLFQHLLGAVTEPQRGARGAWEPGCGVSSGSGQTQEAAGGRAGLMNGDLAAGKVSRAPGATGEGGLGQETLPRLPEVEGASRPHCTDGKTGARREHVTAEVLPPSRGCPCLSSGRGE